MICPFCRHKKTDIYNTRPTTLGNSIWRRRRCLRCSQPFTTYEQVSLVFLKISKKNGSIEPYLRSKLFTSLLQACSGLPKVAETVDALTDTVEIKLLNRQESRSSSTVIAATALGVLKRYNSAAFVRYLSYRTDLISDAQLKKALKEF